MAIYNRHAPHSAGKLAAEFGAGYRDHQRAVPMLIPWHAPRWPDTGA